MKPFAPAIVLLALLSAPAGAQTVYKYRMPDGRIVYTSETLPNAKLLDTLRDPQPPQPVDEKRRAAMERERQNATQSSARRLDAINAANERVTAATRALEAAKARQAAGVEPEEGERIGTVRGGGRGRARDAYNERQAELQQAVDAAQKDLDNAYAERNAAR